MQSVSRKSSSYRLYLEPCWCPVYDMQCLQSISPCPLTRRVLFINLIIFEYGLYGCLWVAWTARPRLRSGLTTKEAAPLRAPKRPRERPSIISTRIESLQLEQPRPRGRPPALEPLRLEGPCLRGRPPTLDLFPEGPRLRGRPRTLTIYEDPVSDWSEPLRAQEEPLRAEAEPLQALRQAQVPVCQYRAYLSVFDPHTGPHRLFRTQLTFLPTIPLTTL
jgi:hypothetical protein